MVMSKLACASGLYLLEQGRYKAAALKFAGVSYELGYSFQEVIAPQVCQWSVVVCLPEW